ncbi:energy-coupling factor ABC transporter ATP-binding protein [Achromobacter xylosoxidans]|uniref:energy-coupling factor ABC transporter ATP-binding protein n=1 Tax=Alcaligenes xylosoxydans xylosoxydans TaxID=85698 RepID=UPI0006ABF2F2|nr:ABC transporter ATP-binding protein [Achromobacter xylosoxidans]KOQ20199.1 cobalt ABC transporter ATP-binding protein [Achromobacter xylosoxidans]KOQ24501.1 cobalt ABC transporter ATP-binding protein [Achromobacter xylosoxidans]KOQ30297.1 cobalt ABC transporter ATP-binding protein [Achromobacter xylosoxidans]KOQ40882.1 cobalt ABC transporter ATP-binding protein [Achromobacter xylosoxidans]KOQ47800.1 cobalt ABC transporter ATP-binding protein [Achromobacter xylosoxidans]
MLIEFDQAIVSTPQAEVLRGVSAALDGRRIGIVGPNGAGKSTLARLVNGLVLPSSGRVRVGGLDTRHELKAVRRQVGFVFQNPENQIVFPIVREDLAFGLKQLEPDRAQREARIEAELAALGVAHLADRTSHTLSGGERQLVALAAVLVMRPGLVVFDEPTTQLDLRNRNRVRDAIAAMPQDAIVVSHDLALLEDFERVLVIQDGVIAADDTPAAALRWYRDRCA